MRSRLPQAGLGRLLGGLLEAAHQGGLRQVGRCLEARAVEALFQSTRLTNDGAYRRYRSEPLSPEDGIPDLPSSSGSPHPPPDPIER